MLAVVNYPWGRMDVERAITFDADTLSNIYLSHQSRQRAREAASPKDSAPNGGSYVSLFNHVIAFFRLGSQLA